jgi:hypothetical protein
MPGTNSSCLSARSGIMMDSRRMSQIRRLTVNFFTQGEGDHPARVFALSLGERAGF